jgi:hypothetical protein
VLVISFGLVRVTLENGHIEIAPGTHHMARKEALRAVEAGEIGMQAIPLEIGDVLIRHPWALHRGAPSTIDMPRALVSLDRTFVFSGGYYAPFGYLLLVNGHPQPDSVELHSSTRYWLRFINITDNGVDLRVRLSNKGVPVQWTVIAKDGADLPLAQLKSSTADFGITVGETYDVEYQAETPELADLEIWQPQYPTPVTLPLKFVKAK